MLNIEHVSKQFGPQKILEDAELFIGWGDRCGLVGPNGTGKTTLFRLIAKTEEPDAGRVRFDDHISCDMLSQESQCALGVTVREEMLSAFTEAHAAQSDIDALTHQLAHVEADSFESREALRKLAAAQNSLEMQEEHTMEARIGRVLKGLGFGDDALDRLTDTFSGGWQMRIAMAKLLLREPDLLLLDEPTNHLDEKARKWLMEYLETYPGAIFMISHEPRFLNSVCNSIVELDDYKLREYTGNFDNFQQVKQQEKEAQISAYERQQRELERQQEFINRFGAKNTKATQVKSREKQLAKIEIIEAPRVKERTMILQFPEAVKSALDVMRVKNIHKTYEDAEILRGIDLKVARGQRIALLGPNGAGKSTLLRILAGAEEPDAGGIREIGRNVVLGYFAQHQAEALDLNKTVLEEVLDGLERQPESEARGFLGRLGVRGEDVFKQVKVLSGGERSRVALAKFMMRPANTLLLDEPTNHLDPMSREVLQGALEAFEGTVILVSHDRPFVNAVAKEAYRVEDGKIHEIREPLGGAPKGGKKKK